MAQSSDTNLRRVCAGLMRYLDFGGIPGVLKVDLRGAVDAVDLWVSDNASSYVNTLPEPFKSNSSTSQKSFLLVAVILMRHNLELLRRIVGEVD